MNQRLSSLFTVVVFALSVLPASAANKEHQQLMADIRMLQEQTQLLQTLLGTLNESLKAVNARIDQQSETNRKALADQKLVIDNLSNDVKVIREKLDDNNVRVGTLSQEVDALRQSLQQLNVRPAPVPTEPTDTTGAGGATAPGGTAPGATALNAPTGGPAFPIGASPAKMWDAAWGDYTAGVYDLAIHGFEEYIRAFPKADLADDAQVLVGNSYLQLGKYDKAVESYDKAIRTYPSGNAIPEAYYKKGLALSQLKDLNGAREAWETLVKSYPDSAARQQAQQGLDRLKKP
jgi:tol-pal system protein YbgF